jgi:hypothetical protein
MFQGITALPPRTLSQTLPLSPALTSLSSPEGTRLLNESTAKADFLPLVSQFTTQINPAYCGVASSVMVLNALGIKAPLAKPWQSPYFTQENLLNSKTDQVLPATTIAQQGLTLDQLAAVLAQYPVKVQTYHGADLSLSQMRQLIEDTLRESDQYILVNYLRATIGQERGGHISPLAAYNRARDQVLILDVSRYKYPPVWVSLQTLWRSINTIDSTSQKTRGLVTIGRQAP